VLKRLFVVLAMTVGSAGVDAQNRPLQMLSEPGSTTYLVFFRQRPVGREEVTVVRSADGWTVRGTSQLGGPIDITTRRAEVRYDVDWKPLSLIVDSVAGGQDMQLRATFANGTASNELVTQGATTPKDIPVSADAVVLPNTFLGSYAESILGAAKLDVPNDVMNFINTVLGALLFWVAWNFVPMFGWAF